MGSRGPAGVTDRPELVVADVGYWNVEHINHVIGDEHLQVLIPPDSGKRKGARQGWTGGLFDWMRHALDTDHGRALYRQRRETIEPIFWSHQTQPRVHPLSPTRTVSRADRMAADDEHPRDSVPSRGG
jgi:hypothetical protein